MNPANHYASPRFESASNTLAHATSAETPHADTPTVFTRAEQSSSFLTVTDRADEPPHLDRIFSTYKDSAIHTLNLSGSDLNGCMFIFLLTQLNSRPPVNTLNLSSCGFQLRNTDNRGRPVPFNMFMSGLKAMPSNLILRNCFIGSNAFRAIANRLKTDETLHSLDLANNYFVKEDVQLLAEALQENFTLSDISLAGSNLGTTSVDALVSLLLSSKSLERLDLSDSQFSPDDKARLQQANAFRTGKPLVLVL
jgi:hypothetical protein